MLFSYVDPRPIRIRFVFILVRIDFWRMERDTSANEETHMIISVFFGRFFLGPEKVVEIPIQIDYKKKKKSVSTQ